MGTIAEAPAEGGMAARLERRLRSLGMGLEAAQVRVLATELDRLRRELAERMCEGK